MSKVNYPSYVDALLALLDRIEAVAGQADMSEPFSGLDEIILQITRQWHQIARDRGFTVEFGGPASGVSH